MSHHEPLIVCDHLSCTYGQQAVVDDVYLTVHRGEFVGIVGPSGSGKTTLLRTILGSHPVAHGAGQVVADDEWFVMRHDHY